MIYTVFKFLVFFSDLGKLAKPSCQTVPESTGGGGGGSIGPYANSFPLLDHFQGGGLGLGGGGLWASQEERGGGASGPQHMWLKMTASLR